MTNVKIGDVVIFKSGGPVMTVNDVENDLAVCRWFVYNDGRNQAIDQHFAKYTLLKINMIELYKAADERPRSDV